MKFLLIIVIFLVLVGSIPAIACKEQTRFIPDPELPVVKKPKAKDRSLPEVLTSEKTLALFLLLPKKVLPLSNALRKLALADEEIKCITKDKQITVQWRSSPTSENGTEMHCIGYSLDQEPIVEVVYSWRNPGMILKSHSYTYQLTRKTNGWLIKRID